MIIIWPCHTVQFFLQLATQSTLGRCKIGKYMFPSQFANIFFTYKTFVINLHLLRVEYQYRPTLAFQVRITISLYAHASKMRQALSDSIYLNIFNLQASRIAFYIFCNSVATVYKYVEAILQKFKLHKVNQFKCLRDNNYSGCICRAF